jgi:hypothetical protein
MQAEIADRSALAEVCVAIGSSRALGLTATTPHQAARILAEPAPSLLVAKGTAPAATAAADPADEPPGTRSARHGFRVGPPRTSPHVCHAVPRGTDVAPTGTAPAPYEPRDVPVAVLLPRLHRDRHPCQRRSLTRRDPGVHRRCGVSRAARPDVRERMQTRVDLCDPRQRLVDHVDRSDPSRPHVRDDT